MTILDRYGTPMKSPNAAMLSKEIATPSLTGVRKPSAQSVAAGLDPLRLTSLLKRADQGDATAYLTLAAEMEERDAQYGSVMRTRRLALAGLEPEITAASDDPKDEEIADAARTLLADPIFYDLISDALDALGKGFSVIEIVWDTTSTPWKPVQYLHRSATWFQFDKRDQTKILHRVEGKDIGAELEPWRFIVHKPRFTTGIPLKSGLARMAAWSYLFKLYALKDWVGYAEVYGMPMRIGRYGPKATPQDIQILMQAIYALGSDAAAVIPASMNIDFQQVASGKGGADVFEKLARFMDEQISKAVLGQTMTTDSGSSRSQAEVHADVRADLLKADARQLAATLMSQLIRPFVALNFGEQAAYPTLRWPFAEPEDIAAITDAAAKLVPLGLKIGQAALRRKLGLPDPEDDDDVLGSTPPSADPPPVSTSKETAAAILAALRLPGQPELAAVQQPDALEDLAADALADDGWERAVEPTLDALKRLIEEAGSLEEVRDRLGELSHVDKSAFIHAMGRDAFSAHLAGAVGADITDVSPEDAE